MVVVISCSLCLFGFSFKFVSIQRCPLEIEAAHYSYKQSVMTRGFVGERKMGRERMVEREWRIDEG